MTSSISRRAFLGTGLAGVLLAPTPGVGVSSAGAHPAPVSPFTLGIASGDPTHHSVVLWTRLAPDPLHGGGMPPIPVLVRWEVATDHRMHHVVRHGLVLAWPQRAHSVHVEVHGLAPDRWYWYRFFFAGHASPTGRTRTFPSPGDKPGRMRFAVASCQNFEQGFYTAWANLAQEDLDFVVHLGDYIYEDAAGSGPFAVRPHDGPEPTTLGQYRNRHALYRLDPNLQAAHARFPFIVTWDDHEVEDNYADAISTDNDIPGQTPVPPDVFLARRAAAYEAYFEHMPLPREAAPDGPDARIFRRLRFGRLAEINVLDTRQFRSNQPCGGVLDQLPPQGDDLAFGCGGELDPAATLLGPEQEAWLHRGLRRSDARWNVLAQQVMMAQVNFFAETPVGLIPFFNMDAWDGAVVARRRLLGFIADAGVPNVVVLTGDIHSSWAADLKVDFAAPGAPVVASEFVGTSISSIFPPDFVPLVQAVLQHPANAHVKFFEGLLRGYVVCDVDRHRWRTDYRAVDTVFAPVSPVQTIASFAVEDGHPGVVPV